MPEVVYCQLMYLLHFDQEKFIKLFRLNKKMLLKGYGRPLIQHLKAMLPSPFA